MHVFVFCIMQSSVCVCVCVCVCGYVCFALSPHSYSTIHFSPQEENTELHHCLHTQTVFGYNVQKASVRSPSDQISSGPQLLRETDMHSHIIYLGSYEKQWESSCVHPSQGRSGSHIFYHKSIQNDNVCLVKVQLHVGEMLVKCLSSPSTHSCGDCCQGVQNFWNNRKAIGAKDALLRSTLRSGVGYSSTGMIQHTVSTWPANPPDTITGEPKWFLRNPLRTKITWEPSIKGLRIIWIPRSRHVVEGDDDLSHSHSSEVLNALTSDTRDLLFLGSFHLYGSHFASPTEIYTRKPPLQHLESQSSLSEEGVESSESACVLLHGCLLDLGLFPCDDKDIKTLLDAHILYSLLNLQSKSDLSIESFCQDIQISYDAYHQLHLDEDQGYHHKFVSENFLRHAYHRFIRSLVSICVDVGVGAVCCPNCH